MPYLLDNFAYSEKSCFGSSWEAINDQPMEGLSQIELHHQNQSSPTSLRIRGQVQLLPPAGYIEAALPLIHSRRLFDAREFTGVCLKAQIQAPPETTQIKTSERFFVRLQTRELSMPWQYYQAAFSPTSHWQTFQIPFSQFQAINTTHLLNPERLTRISIAAANFDFEVDLTLSEIGFY